MRVTFVKPPLEGHATRGVGIYAQNLFSALGKYTNVNIFWTEKDQLPLDVDIYHFPYFDPFFLTLPWNRYKKTIVTIHDLIPIHFPRYFPRGIKGEIKWQVQQFLVRRVDAIITDSYASKRDIIKFTGIDTEKIFVVFLAPNEIFFQKKTEKVKKMITNKYSLPQKYVLYVGDINWNKNLITLLEAIKIINIPLVIISKSFKELIEENKTSDLLKIYHNIKDKQLVKVIGFINENELVAIYQSAQALIMPSYYEGFGLPVVEAFASGCPVISTNKGSLSEIINNAALTTEPNDHENIADAIKKIYLDQSLRQKLCREGKKWVSQYTWKNTAQQTYKIYEQVLSK